VLRGVFAALLSAALAIIAKMESTTTPQRSHSAPPWKVSLHGGHSGSYCDHAKGTLLEVLEAACAFGYHTFGVSEHVPRLEEQHIYREEIAMGWTLETLQSKFEQYQQDVDELAERFADRLIVLRGFECEVVPSDRYVQQAKDLLARGPFDFFVGSVHFVDDLLIDGPLDIFQAAIDKAGSLENLAVRYYELMAQMIQALSPPVVGHFDLIRKNAVKIDASAVETAAVKAAAAHALDAAAACDAILDLNVAGYRKGLDSPYPAPWVVSEALARGLAFCFGDDSHGPEQVGANVARGRQYLLENGVRSVTVLTKENQQVVRRTVALQDD
jgi:histidinol-phosphatase (PHP family)